MIETISIYQWLFVFAFWLVLLIRSRKQITYNYCSEGIGQWGFIIAIAIFSTFAFLTGDFSNYRELYNLISIQKTEIHLEPFYCWLIFLKTSEICMGTNSYILSRNTKQRKSVIYIYE